MMLSDIANEEDFIFALCTFIDKFKISDDKEKLLKNEPRDGLDSTSRCILAGTAQKLSNDYGLNSPEWINKDIYFLSSPIFAFDTTNKDFQKYLLETTPEEFASRNVFYGEKVLERV